MLTIKQDVPNGRIEGTCDERFAGVAREFARNFDERGEVGASASLTLHGETLVDLWGGIADPATGRAWERDTVGIVFSCTKGATALCAHLLASRGLLDVDAPVAEYWPEFAVRGKHIDLMMSGHTHGGQIRFPLLGAPHVDSSYGQRYVRGLNRTAPEQGTPMQVYTTRGIGTVLLPVRLDCPPEIVLYTLRQA